MLPDLTLSPANTYDILFAKFKKLALTVDELTELTGEKPQSIRNAICAGKYPIASYAATERKRLFLLADVAHYIDRQRQATLERSVQARSTISPSSLTSATPVSPAVQNALSNAGGKRRRGRPTKAESLAKVSLGQAK